MKINAKVRYTHTAAAAARVGFSRLVNAIIHCIENSGRRQRCPRIFTTTAYFMWKIRYNIADSGPRSRLPLELYMCLAHVPSLSAKLRKLSFWNTPQSQGGKWCFRRINSNVFSWNLNSRNSWERKTPEQNTWERKNWFTTFPQFFLSSMFPSLRPHAFSYFRISLYTTHSSPWLDDSIAGDGIGNGSDAHRPRCDLPCHSIQISNINIHRQSNWAPYARRKWHCNQFGGLCAWICT